MFDSGFGVTWSPTVYLIPPFAAAAIAVPVWIETWRHRDEPAAEALLAVVGVLFAWSVAYGIQLGFTTLSTGLIWQRISLMFGAMIPPVWLLFSLRYTGLDDGLRDWMLAVLAAEPIAFAAMVWTNPSHQLLWKTVSQDGQPGIELAFAAGYYVHITYAYVLVAVGVAALAWLAADATEVHRKQSAVLVLAALVPFAANVAYTLGLTPIPGLDLTTFTFALSTSLFALALFRLDLLEIAPVARRHWIEQLGDGVVVLDANERVVEINDVALGALEPTPQVGRSLAESLPAADPSTADGTVLDATFDGESRFYDLRHTPLTDHRGDPAGSLVGLRDVTESTRYEQRLEVANRVLRHNFRNAMNVVQGHAETLAADLDGTDADRARVIARRADEVIDLNEGIQQIATTIDADGGDAVIVDLAILVDSVVESAQLAYPTVRFTVDAPESVEAAAADRNLVRTAVEHVVENAAEYNDADEPTVEVSVVEAAGQVTVRVADNGPGIPEQERQVVQGGQETPLVHGSGVGLWVVSWVATASGGELAFTENAPRGSVVTLELPTAA